MGQKTVIKNPVNRIALTVTHLESIRVFQAIVIKDIVFTSDFEDPYYKVPKKVLTALRQHWASGFGGYNLLSPGEFLQLIDRVRPTRELDEPEGYEDTIILLCEPYKLPLQFSRAALTYLRAIAVLAQHEAAADNSYDEDIAIEAAVYQMCEDALSGKTSSDEAYVSAFSRPA